METKYASHESSRHDIRLEQWAARRREHAQLLKAYSPLKVTHENSPRCSPHDHPALQDNNTKWIDDLDTPGMDVIVATETDAKVIVIVQRNKAAIIAILNNQPIFACFRSH